VGVQSSAFVRLSRFGREQMGVPIATLPLQEDARASLKEVFVVEAVRVWRVGSQITGCSTNPSSLADGAQLAHTKEKKGRFGVGAELRGQILDRPPILRGSVRPSKAPLAYRPTSSLPNPPGQVKRRKKG
jgi:hypothetical protein